MGCVCWWQFLNIKKYINSNQRLSALHFATTPYIYIYKNKTIAFFSSFRNLPCYRAGMWFIFSQCTRMCSVSSVSRVSDEVASSVPASCRQVDDNTTRERDNHRVKAADSFFWCGCIIHPHIPVSGFFLCVCVCVCVCVNSDHMQQHPLSLESRIIIFSLFFLFCTDRLTIATALSPASPSSSSASLPFLISR